MAPIPAWNPVVHLGRLAAVLHDAVQELSRAREQSTKPKHLFIRARRTVVQAARAVIEAVDRGIDEAWPTGKHDLRLSRNGKNVGPDGALSDDAVFSIWKVFICPDLRSTEPVQKADAGGFDFPAVKTGEDGRVLGKDGKPLEPVDIIDSVTGEKIGWELNEEPASVTDDYDDADGLEHLRCQAADWADCCAIAEARLRSAADKIRRDAVVYHRQLLVDCLRTLFKGSLADDELRTTAGKAFADDGERRVAAQQLPTVYEDFRSRLKPWLHSIQKPATPITIKATNVAATESTAHEALLTLAGDALTSSRLAQKLGDPDWWKQLRAEKITPETWASFTMLLDAEFSASGQVSTPPDKPATLTAVMTDLQMHPELVSGYEGWNELLHFACERFGGPEFTVATLKLVVAWLVTTQGVAGEAAWGLTVSDVAQRLKAAAGKGPSNDDDRWVTVAAAEKISGANRGVISRAVNRGELQGNRKAGSERRIDRADLTRWMEKRAAKPEPQESDAAVRKKLGKVK